LDSLGLPDAWLVSGCLFQTVWNVLGHHGPARGIRDYALFYFDASDTSSETEEQLNRQAAALFSDQDCTIDIRNQARVHEWYFDEFGVEGYPRLRKFNRVVRPNPWFPNAPRDPYVKKAERWRELWPDITILPFTEAAPR
jgi:hypothetical protein